jgi:VanZ family protein
MIRRRCAETLEGEVELSFTIFSRITAWLLLAGILILTLAPPQFRPETSLSHELEHAGIFLLAGISFEMGYPRREWLLCVGAIIYCSGIEAAQLLVSGRHARLSDFFVDAISACAAIILGSTLLRSWVKRY